MKAEKKKRMMRARKRKRIRKKITGTPERPRLSVFRSHRHIYCQIVDDLEGRVLAAASTQGLPLKGTVGYGGNKAAAKAVGEEIAKRAKEKKITSIVFDRGGYKYHGRVKELADAARAAGLVF